MKALVVKRLAASTYKYAESLNQSGNLLAAAEGFLSVSNVSPRSSVSAQAEYDAAVAYIKLEKWVEAINILEQFRIRYPSHNLQAGVTDKLAACYEKNKQFSLAANEILRIGKRSKNTETYKDATLQAAGLYEKDTSRKLAINTYKSYVRDFKLSQDESLEIKQKLADLYVETGEIKKRHFWLKNIASTNRKGKHFSDRSKYILASASIYIANEKMSLYTKADLTHPLKKSLKRKQKLMKSALLAYEDVSDIGVEEFTTAATFNIASIYQHLGSAIMKSQRPLKLNPEEREEYDLLLEEQAFPFEEKAIKIYELNVHRIADGVYDDWVQKSLTQLGLIQPARYGKQEVLDEMYTSID